MPAEHELRVHALLECRELDFLQAAARILRERIVVEVCEHRAAPQSQGITLELERLLGLAASEGMPCVLRQSFEPLQVERPGATRITYPGERVSSFASSPSALRSSEISAIHLGGRRDGARPA